MKKLLLFVFLALPSFLHSQDIMETHPIDNWYYRCAELGDTTSGLIPCADSATVLWYNEMNNYYNLLIDKLDEGVKNSLAESQIEWKKYLDKETETIKSFHYYLSQRKGKDRFINPNAGSESIMEIVKNRALVLKGMYEEI